MKPLIKKLVESYGPSGSEDQIRDVIRQEIRSVPDYISVDPLGSLIAVVKKGTRTGKKVLLSAHMDEIGFIVSHVDDNGFVRFQPLGAINPLACVGARVRFGNGTLGVIHLDVRREDLSKTPALSDMFIDVGAASRAACPVGVGDTAGYQREMVEQGDRLVGKSMDNRISVAILIETLRRLKRTPHEVAFVFSVQEEVGLRGAGPAAYGLEADLGLAVDVTATGDTPNGRRMDVRLGAGPAVKVRDARMLADPRVKNLLVQRAREAGLPTQLEILEGGSTDAAAIQVAGGGVPAGALSIPCRYVHTPSEMVDFRDVQAAVGLLLAVLEKPIEL
jgi:putative aminopeptidase FrvX